MIQDALGREIKVGNTVVVQHRHWNEKEGRFTAQTLATVVRMTEHRETTQVGREYSSTRIYYVPQGQADTWRYRRVVTSGRRLVVVGPGLGLV